MGPHSPLFLLPVNFPVMNPVANPTTKNITTRNNWVVSTLQNRKRNVACCEFWRTTINTKSATARSTTIRGFNRFLHSKLAVTIKSAVADDPAPRVT